MMFLKNQEVEILIFFKIGIFWRFWFSSIYFSIITKSISHEIYGQQYALAGLSSG